MPTPAGADDAGYRRSSRSPRGEARRRELLAAVTDDVLGNGLSDFSLRRAARAAGTTHKVLLYHFDDSDDLLAHVVGELRARRIESGLALAQREPGTTLSGRIRAIWQALAGPEAEALDQAMGLAMLDPARHERIAATALGDYLPPLRGLCPAQWPARRKDEVASLVLATLRGLVLTRRTSPDAFDPEPALLALIRAVTAEENRLDSE